jgi:signal transduction histidine kinase
MLSEFIVTYRDPIIARAREKVTARPWPTASAHELENGVPLFLTQLAGTLRSAMSSTASTVHADAAITSGATRHGRELLGLGFTVSQVVHDYGDICQAVTEIAIEEQAPITTEEFKTLNRCLDMAIADAVTEHARITAESRSLEESERVGHLAHETRDLLNTALLAYQTLKRGTVAINGSTGAVLGRSLMGLRDLVESTLTEVRISANHHQRVPLPVTPFVKDIAAAAGLAADSRGLSLVVDAGDEAWVVDADAQLLSSAVMNLLNNAINYTPPGGHIALRALSRDGRLRIEVEDQCGGVPESVGDPFQPNPRRRGGSRPGLGLGLSIARKAVRAHGGDISVRNMPGTGCVFVIDLPLAAGRALEAS